MQVIETGIYSLEETLSKYRYRYEVAEEVLRQGGTDEEIQRRVMEEFPHSQHNPTRAKKYRQSWIRYGHCRINSGKAPAESGKSSSSMPFVTYENYRNPHVTIHISGCTQIGKRGGKHKAGQGKYEHHASSAAAEHYALGTGLDLVRCSFCKPAERPMPSHPFLPEEIDEDAEFFEGAARTVLVNVYERDRGARASCIDHYGPQCAVCGMSFDKSYGPVADGLIHVHHLQPLSDIGEEYKVDPIADLRPICPNCHAVIHLREPPYEIDDVKRFLR